MIKILVVAGAARWPRPRRAVVCAFGTALVLTGASLTLSPLAAVAQQPKTPQTAPSPAPPADTRTPQIRMEMELTREAGEESGVAAATPAPVLLASPSLTTLDRSTASVSVAGATFGYTISLSPTLEMQAGAAGTPPTQTLQTLWNIRLAGRDLPGAVQSVSQTGATRTGLRRRETLVILTLRDPKTGTVARYRLTVKPTVEVAAATKL